MAAIWFCLTLVYVIFLQYLAENLKKCGGFSCWPEKAKSCHGFRQLPFSHGVVKIHLAGGLEKNCLNSDDAR